MLIWCVCPDSQSPIQHIYEMVYTKQTKMSHTKLKPRFLDWVGAFFVHFHGISCISVYATVCSLYSDLLQLFWLKWWMFIIGLWQTSAYFLIWNFVLNILRLFSAKNHGIFSSFFFWATHQKCNSTQSEMRMQHTKICALCAYFDVWC